MVGVGPNLGIFIGSITLQGGGGRKDASGNTGCYLTVEGGGGMGGASKNYCSTPITSSMNAVYRAYNPTPFDEVCGHDFVRQLARIIPQSRREDIDGKLANLCFVAPL